MEENFYLRMEAHNPERNHHRRYEFELGKDLFGIWTLIIRYGRVGRPGQSQTYSSEDKSELEKLIQSRIKRRAGAEQRIGCRYESAAEGGPRISTS